MSSLNPGLLRNQMAGIRRKHPDASLIAMRSRSRWDADSSLRVDGEEFMVAQCDSELAIREAALKASTSSLPLVIITELQEPEIGTDMLARFLRRKLLRMDVWDSLRDLLDAKIIDRRVQQHRWVADSLMDSVADGGYRPAPGGVLTLEHLWGEFLTQCLQLPSGTPDARHILVWAMLGNGPSKFRNLPADQQSDIEAWVSQSAGELGSFLLRILAKSGGPSILACGLSCEVVFSDQEEAKQLRDAAIRLERRTANQPIPRQIGAAWGQCSLEALHDLNSQGHAAIVQAVEDELDLLLPELGVEDYGWMSSVSSRSFEARMDRFGSALQHVLRDHTTDIAALWGFADDLRQHRHAGGASERIERAVMACRLTQWLASQRSGEPACGNGVGDMAGTYFTEGSFVDWARNSLYAGDGSEATGKAYAKLLSMVGELRELQNKAFADALVRAVGDDSYGPSTLCIEDLLDQVVCPVLDKKPALLIVIDGMSMAVFRQLLEDMVMRMKWVEHHAVSTPWPRPVLAAFPTVTEYCRASIFKGSLPDSGSSDEQKALRSHKGVSERCGAQRPVLFKKGDLLADGGSELSASLKKEIASVRRKLVCAVVNAVDDHLLRGDQVNFSWTVAHIPVLEKLLYAARTADRAVIITSDHGHVLDRSTELREGSGSERYRKVDGDVCPQETIIKGRRVLAFNGTIVAPWGERLRYGAKKNGYHGGVSPQEVIVPAVVLSASDLAEGYEPCPFIRPNWWERTPSMAAATVLIPKKRLSEKPSGLPLFDRQVTTGEQTDDWIDQLLRSDLTASQRKMSGRTSLDDQRIRDFLESVEGHGGAILLPALAQSIGQPLLRIRGIVTAMQRLLNVEGYSVLTHDAASDTVSLNRKLLCKQFEIDA